MNLGSVCDVVAGQSPQGKYYNTDGDGLPFYQGKKEFGERFIGKPVKWTTNVTKKAIEGDILMSVRAPVGPINLATRDICIGRGLAAIRPHENELDRDFLYYYLMFKQSDIAGNEGAVFASINKSQIEAIGVPLPKLDMQKRVVDILDKAFEGIHKAIVNTEQNLANARELLFSELNRIFTQDNDGWAAKKLSSIVDISHGFAFKGKDFDVSCDDSKPIVLTPGNYSEDGGLSFTSRNTKRLLTGVVPEGYQFATGELTIVMTDLSPKMKILGMPAFVDTDNLLHNQRIGRIHFKCDDVAPRYLYYFLQSKRVSDNIKLTATGTMVRHTAPCRILSNFIAYPDSKREQQRIITKLDELGEFSNRLVSTYLDKFDSLRLLKQAVMHKAFAGELSRSGGCLHKVIVG